MEITINLEKNKVYLISIIFIMLISILSVKALITYNNIPSPGHGGYNVWIKSTDGVEKTLQDAISNFDFLGKEGIPVRNYETTNDCSEELSPANPSCNNVNYQDIFPESIIINSKTICFLREVAEWSPVNGDGKQSSCTINLIDPVNNNWELKSDGAHCRAYCLNWE